LQLQRGVGSSTNGAGAFGASLNLLTDAISEKSSGEISNSAGSYKTRKHTIKFSTGILNIKSDGYIDRASSDLDSYFLQASYVDDNTLIKALTFGGKEITYQAWNGVSQEQIDMFGRTYNPSGEYTDENDNTKFYDNEIDNYKQDHYQLHWNERFNNFWSSNIGLNYTYGRGYFEQYKQDQDFADYDFLEITLGSETINKTDLIRRRWLDNDFYVVNANINYKKDQLNMIFGGSYSSYKGDHYGEVIWAQFAGNSEIRDHYYDSKSDKTDINFFGKATYKINKNLSLFGDIQARFIDYKTTGLNSDRLPLNVNKNYNFFNPKAGITYNINKANQLYFSYAKANREPSRTDFENGDPRPEKLNDFELGWRLGNDNFQLNSNIYFMKYKDQLILTGEIDDVGAPIRENSGKSYRLGIEIEAAIQLSNKFIIQPNIALSSNKNIDFITPIDGELVNLGNTTISYAPSVVAANQLQFNPNDELQFSFLSKYVGKQYLGNVDSNVSKLDAYFVNDISLIYEIKTRSVFKSIIVTGLVNNIFNEKYISNGYYYTYDDDFSNPGEIKTIEGTGYYPQATTNFLVGVTLKF
jgi:iron complex outermembrane receptor protein